jgi:hypothetical protein
LLPRAERLPLDLLCTEYSGDVSAREFDLGSAKSRKEAISEVQNSVAGWCDHPLGSIVLGTNKITMESYMENYANRLEAR